MSKNDRLKQFISSENITQKEFALKIDSTQQYVSALLNGSRKLGSNILERIEKEFDINIVWLLTGEGEMKKGTEKKEMQANDDQVKYKLEERITLLDVRDDLKADLAVIAEGMTVNFEKVAGALFESLKGQQKILKFINKIDADRINKATGKLDEFLEVNKK